MSKFQGKTRSGKTIKNYRKRADFILEGQPNGVKVPSEDKGDLEKALKVFKRQMKDSGKFETLREKRYYEKPSAKKYKLRSDAKRYAERQARHAAQNDKRYGCWTAIIDGQAL